MPLNRRPVASLWIGESLHYVNQLCLKSHLVQGHPVTLYCTDTVRNVPEGVEVRPAEEIMQIPGHRGGNLGLVPVERVSLQDDRGDRGDLDRL